MKRLVSDFGYNTTHFTSGREKAVVRCAAAAGLPLEDMQQALIRDILRNNIVKNSAVKSGTIVFGVEITDSKYRTIQSLSAEVGIDAISVGENSLLNRKIQTDIFKLHRIDSPLRRFFCSLLNGFVGFRPDLDVHRLAAKEHRRRQVSIVMFSEAVLTVQEQNFGSIFGATFPCFGPRFVAQSISNIPEFLGDRVELKWCLRIHRDTSHQPLYTLGPTKTEIPDFVDFDEPFKHPIQNLSGLRRYLLRPPCNVGTSSGVNP